MVSVMACVEQRKDAWRIFTDRKEFGRLLLIALAGLLLYQYAYLSAIRFSNSGTATVLQSSCVVMVFVFVILRKRIQPKPKQILAIGMALAGVFLIATNGRPDMMVLSPEALFWGLGAVVGTAVYSLLSQSAVHKWGNRNV
jgi:drug/metabolite transporter (DMT)-like permease